MSSYIAQRLSGENKPENEVKFVIVDRDTRRRKLDKNFREEFYTVREKMDIADFNVEKFLEEDENIKDNSELLCVAKHLCGGATDLSLTSILKRQSKWPIQGVAIATCCHHQCDLKTYCNLKFLKDEGFTEDEIAILPRITSWAITQGSTTLEKKEIGFKAKRIIDYSRVLFIR